MRRRRRLRVQKTRMRVKTILHIQRQREPKDVLPSIFFFERLKIKD